MCLESLTKNELGKNSLEEILKYLEEEPLDGLQNKFDIKDKELFILNNLKLYLFLGVLDLPCCFDFSLVMETKGYSLFAMCGLFIAMASFVVEHRL